MQRAPLTDNDRMPITCEQHDYLEIACLFHLAISVETLDGEQAALTPRDITLSQDKVEWLVGSKFPDGDAVNIRTDSIVSITAVNPNPHFDTVVFKPS